MLSRDKLMDLYRELGQEKVLTIYLDGAGTDPAKRKVWRTRLEHEISAIEESLRDATDHERDDFREALSRLMEQIDAFDAFVPGLGWVGFATPDQVWYTESVPVPMPTLARWEEGIRAAPYVRGLKQDRVVMTVLLDSRRARIFEYRDGELYEGADIRADTFLGDLTDVNISKRAATHSGTRGETGTDAAQRVLDVSSERMRKELMRVIQEKVGEKGFLVLGGTPEMVAAAAADVPKSIRERVLERPSLHVEMSLPEVKSAIEEAATELSCGHQATLVRQVVDQARAKGKGCLGREATERALRERRVDTLLLARSFIRGDPDFADRCVGTAFEQDAAVEEVSGEASELLQAEAGGIGARLRYRRPSEARPSEAGVAE